jgi:hypothetical protein
MRQDNVVEGPLLAKHHGAGKYKKRINKKIQESSSETAANNENAVMKGDYPPCHHCEKKGHPLLDVGRDPMQNAANVTKWDTKV